VELDLMEDFADFKAKAIALGRPRQNWQEPLNKRR